jgi:tetratricopeptide (TPR) repeat protein
MLAQSAPPSCPADRPVDDIITEVHKEHSKKKNRNSNPFPNVECIFGWCRSGSSKQTPPTFPEPAPESAPPAQTPGANESSSSSKPPVDKCDEAMERALKAAHDVEVGDEYFEAKNLNAALMRYKDALEEKPGDIAIHVRLGRVFEKLGQVPQAIEQYKAAQELAGPKKWLDEAKAALLRLQRSPGS